MLNAAINWFAARQGNVTYSMANRNGPGSYDCSSAIYYALIEAGIFPVGIRIGNTDTLFGDLERHGFTRLPEINGSIAAQCGDVFIWGVRGASSGAFGHTGMFTDANNIIHCAYGYNGITVTNHDYLYVLNGYPENTIYRYTGTSTPEEVGNPNDQSLDIGSWIRFDHIYRVDDLQHIGGIWQVLTNALCKNNFTWNENGIPAEPITEVDSNGYATPDQNLDVGSLYKIPGKYKVLDLSYIDDMWLALIEWNGLKFWVDVETATEVPSTDPGAPTPGQRPAPPTPKPTSPPPPEPTPETPEPEEPAPEPEQPTPNVPAETPKEPIPETPKESETPETNNPKEDKPMAYSKEQLQELSVATKNAQEFANHVAASEGAQELTSGISKKTKLIVYIIGDTLIGLGVLVPNAAIAFGMSVDVNQVVALSGLLSTAGAFLLTMFGIYKSGQK